MKKLMVIICCLIFTIGLQAQDKNDIVNHWEFTAPDAPYGYQGGTFLIKQEEGRLKGEIKTQQSTVAIREIKKENDKYTCSFYIDGQAVDVTIRQKNKDLLEGQALSGGMDIPFTCKPSKK